MNKFVVIVFIVVLFCANVHAAESPSFNVSIVNNVLVDTITQADSIGPGFKPHISFPFMTHRHNGTLLINYTVGQTQSGLQFGKQAISTTSGASWTTSTTLINGGGNQLIKPPGDFSRGFSLGFTTGNPNVGQSSWNNSAFTSTDGGTSWIPGVSLYDVTPTSYWTVSRMNGRVVEIGADTFMVALAQRPFASTFETLIFHSNNLGLNWDRRNTVSGFVGGLNLNMGSEGPNECSVIDLDNGDLLCVFRTGQPFPSSDIESTFPSIFYSHSSDLGFTWTTAKMLGVMGALPTLHKMSDGTIAMTYGRYGCKVMCADPTGKRWTEPFVVHSGPSSGYVDMRSIGGSQWVYCYDESGFYPPSWNASPPAGYVFDNDQSANLWAAILDIQQVTPIEPFIWAVDYHGDVTPSSYPEAWDVVLTGSGISARLWAHLGQDFLRLETGNNGPSNLFNYSLPGGGSGSSWDDMDFAAGVVLETRARVDDANTTEGAATIRLDDGVNGSVAIELTGSGVTLEGDGQITYSGGGFTTLDWHEYRLVVEPDPGSGGAIVASLYLDGDFSTPILTRMLGPSSVDEIIFGDVAGSNNGIFEVDYLRFAKQNCHGDLNCDGVLNGLDIEPMVQALMDPLGYTVAYPACGYDTADTSGNGVVDVGDIGPFVSQLLSEAGNLCD